MSRKRKRGRPPLPKGTAKEGRLYCRVSESEEREIEAAAKASRTSKSVWIRKTLLAGARAKKPAP